MIGRAYDSRATGNVALAANETRSIQIAGTAGVPAMGSGINAVVLTLIVAHGGSNGSATAWADGTARPATTSVNFQTNEIQTNTITVPLGANGKISLNNVAEATNYVVDVQGWYANPQAPKIKCASPFNAGSWVATAPSDEDGVTCTFTAPAATHSGQEIAVNINGMPETSFPLSESGPSTFTYKFTYLVGSVTLEAFVDDRTAATPVTQYQFGVGQWNSESLVPALLDGAVVDPEEALLPTLSSSVILPADAKITYHLSDDTTGAVTESTLDGAPLLASDLTRDHSYTWSASVGAKTGWNTEASLASADWHFRVARDGEAITPLGPDSELAQSDGGFTTMAKPNGCTSAPDKYFKAKFKASCNKHDVCYGSRSSRLFCDQTLQKNLLKACTVAYGKRVAATNGCNAMAATYYYFVRNYTQGHYAGSGNPY